MSKVLTVNVPTDGAVIISRRKRDTGDPAQLDCFSGYCKRWMGDMAEFIRSLPRPVRMSEVRRQAGIAGKPAPLSKNWYGICMRAAGLQPIGFDVSPLKSRRGGVERIWS